MTHIHTEDRDGFKIDFYAVEDFQDVRGQFEDEDAAEIIAQLEACLLYTSPSPRDRG